MPWLKERWTKGAEAQQAESVGRTEDAPVKGQDPTHAHYPVTAAFEVQRKGHSEAEDITSWDEAERAYCMIAEANLEDPMKLFHPECFLEGKFQDWCEWIVKGGSAASG